MIYDFVIGVDPGKQGGIVAITHERALRVFKLSGFTPYSINAAFKELQKLGSKGAVCIESVSSWPGEGVRSAHSFGKAVGHLEMAAIANGYTTTWVQPQVWQKAMALGKVTGNRKHAHRDKAKKLFPELENITLEVCDALLIAEYFWRHMYIPNKTKGKS